MRQNLIWHKSVFSPPDRNSIVESLPESLARVVACRPDATAVVHGDRTYSFQDLACRVAGLAAEINEVSVSTSPIALVQTIGVDALAAWFACSLSGRPFLLLEPDHPPARLLELMEAARCELALVDHKTAAVLSNVPNIDLLISDGRTGIFSLDKVLRADEPAMLFPTSGSTGHPKLITYAATTLQVKVQSSIQLMRVPEGACVMIAGSHGNYGFLHHALVFLLSGGSVCMADVKSAGFDAVLHAVVHQGATHIRFTPSLFRKLAILPQASEVLKRLDGVRFSGEPLLAHDLRLAQSLLRPGCLIQNVYGSTESALFIWSYADEQMLPNMPTVPIGRIYPHASYAIQPLEENKDDDSTGELLIRSTYHALGDFNKGMIDGERFPLSEGSTDERIYATGDVVHQLPDGNLLHLGRLGRMVKVRGHRVFLNEVEQHLRAMPGVTGVAVVERIEQDDTVLYGFITTDNTAFRSADSRAWLAERLPDYMLPRRIQLVSQIPLMAGGKVDYQALIDLIPGYSVETPDEYTKDGFARLIQVWDSILWEGAHEHDADFLALGGDSLSLMTLSAEVERIFGKRLPLEAFRANSTLRNLADILGIERPDTQQLNICEGLHVKLFWPGVQPSKGVALAMPGMNGWAQGYAFHQSGLFREYDIWTADYSIDKGSMRNENRCWRAAVEIVERIRDGSIPFPKIVFGFSFGGGFAWLVARLLAGTPHCPEFVVMVDAPPLHRLKGFRTVALARALSVGSGKEQASVMHIRRSAPGDLPVRKVKTDQWEPKDNIRVSVDLPTVDHLEMIRWNMLALSAEVVGKFLKREEITYPWSPSFPPPDYLGVHIFRAYNGSPSDLQKIIDEWSKVPDSLSLDYLIHMALLFYVKKEKNKATELIGHALKKSPRSGVVQFLHRRIQRNVDWLVSEDIPPLFSFSIASVENRLAMVQTVMDRPKPRPIRLLCLAFDVLISLLTSRRKRYGI